VNKFEYLYDICIVKFNLVKGKIEMDFLTSTILSGIAWDGIKKVGILTGNYIKQNLRDWVLEDSDYEKIAKIINDAPDYAKNSQKFLDAFIDSDEQLKVAMSNATKKISNQQNISGNELYNSPMVQGNGTTIIYMQNDDNVKKKNV
jgi:hypothetical protein